MNKTLTKTTVFLALTIGLTGGVFAGVKKNVPKKPEPILKEAGPEHMPAKMKINKVGSIKSGETFYHVFAGTVKKANPRVIIFDNDQKYLGYYECECEASDYEEGAVLLDSGDTDGDGNTIYYSLKIGPKGPSKKARLDNGMSLTFVKAPEKKEEAAAAGESADKGAPALEYRDWTIIKKGKQLTVRAVFVRIDAGKIVIKSEKSGNEAKVYPTELSKADQEYVKQITKK